jgi:hypothetical protein
MGQINKAVSQLMDRVHGAVIQKTAALNVNVGASKPALPQTIEELDALEAELLGTQAEIEGEMRAIGPNVNEIDLDEEAS